MPLKLAHHKSYHPYNAANIERVRQDEEQARLSEQLGVEMGKSEEGKRRLEKLRGRQGERSREKEGKSDDQQHHTNFWEHLEQPEQRKQKQKAQPLNPDMQITQRQSRWYDAHGDPAKAVDRGEDASGYFSGRLKRRREDPLYDSQKKDKNDPLNAINEATSELARHRQSSERRERRDGRDGRDSRYSKDSKRQDHSSTSTSKSKRERREEKERARARLL